VDKKAKEPREVSVREVAARAGVSLGTVSNTLNRPHMVSPATRARVEQAVLDLGFVRNESARQLKSGRSRMLAYVMLDATNPFFTDVAQGIELAAERADLALVICNSDGRESREQTHLELLRQQRVHGILITPVDPDGDYLHEVSRSTPLVIVDRTSKAHSFCSVAVDDVLGGRLALEHLIDRGHSKVAFVGGPASIGQVADRLEGARQAWSQAGLPPADLTWMTSPALSVVAGTAAGQRLAGMSARRRPTAAFCANDLLALGLLQQSIASGLRVPDDLGIVGYDDIEFAAAAAVPLTSVRQPRRKLGDKAAELVMLEASELNHQHEHIMFVPELVARASTLGSSYSYR